MVLRHWYLLMSSWPRVLGTRLLAGIAAHHLGVFPNSTFQKQNVGFFARAGGTFIGAVILWDILFRGQLGFSMSFLEEMWSRNLGNLLMSPLKVSEYLIFVDGNEHHSSCHRHHSHDADVASFSSASISMVFGFALVAFFSHLIFTSWVIRADLPLRACFIRNGMGAERIGMDIDVRAAAVDMCLLSRGRCCRPGCNSWRGLLPPTYVFEGMRALDDRQGVPRPT